MAVHVLASATGAPGVTTTALGLALLWPGDVLLVDLDRHCSQSVLAGFLGGLDPAGCGLIAAAAAYRGGGSFGTEIGRRTLALPSTGVRREFLPGFTGPATTRMFRPLWSELCRALRQFSDAGVDVVVDAGRVGERGLENELLAEADVVALVTRSSLRSLAGARLYVPDLTEACAAVSRARPGLIVVDPDHPYGTREIEQQFGVPVLGTVTADPVGAAVLCDGAPDRRRGRRALDGALTELADRWHAAAQRRQAVLAGDLAGDLAGTAEGIR